MDDQMSLLLVYVKTHGIQFLLSLWDYPIPTLNIDSIISSFVEEEEMSDLEAIKMLICLSLGYQPHHFEKFKDLVFGYKFEYIWKHVSAIIGSMIYKDLFEEIVNCPTEISQTAFKTAIVLTKIS